MKLDIEFQDDKIAPDCSGGSVVAEELDSLSSSSEGDLRATRRPKLELLDYRVRDQASLCSVRNLALKSGLAGQLRKRLIIDLIHSIIVFELLCLQSGPVQSSVGKPGQNER